MQIIPDYPRAVQPAIARPAACKSYSDAWSRAFVYNGPIGNCVRCIPGIWPRKPITAGDYCPVFSPLEVIANDLDLFILGAEIKLLARDFKAYWDYRKSLRDCAA